jgi:hypothetical protein
MGFQQRKYSRAIFNLGEFTVHDTSTPLPGDVGPLRCVTGVAGKYLLPEFYYRNDVDICLNGFEV